MDSIGVQNSDFAALRMTVGEGFGKAEPFRRAVRRSRKDSRPKNKSSIQRRRPADIGRILCFTKYLTNICPGGINAL